MTKVLFCIDKPTTGPPGLREVTIMLELPEVQLPTTRNPRRGFSLVEMIVAFTVLLALTSMAVPLARPLVRRAQKRNLRIALEDMRKAIDRYKDNGRRE
jgi:prepilin-type N-terminal cleavage/methylation domain-containing protein